MNRIRVLVSSAVVSGAVLLGAASTGAQCLPYPVAEKDKLGNFDGNFPQVLPSGANLGASVASIGDLDGDGVGDLAVGLPQEANVPGTTGAVWILFMAADKSVKAGQKISLGLGGLGPGLISGDRFGHSVASLGDLDGDGVVDLAVGAPYADDTGPNSGSVWILFLNTDGTVKDQQRISGNSGGFVGDLDAADYFSYACVGSLGDLDGDGVIELGVGAYGDDDGGSNTGALWVLFLRTDGTVRQTAKISATTTGAPPLSPAGAFGHAVSLLGDLNGDGLSDIAVGNVIRRTVWVLFLDAAGGVKAFQEISSNTGGLGVTVGGNFGRSLASLGDVTGDGVPDLIVGSTTDDDGYSNAGAAWLLSLTAAGTVQEAQKISATAGSFGAGLSAEDNFGRAVAPVGDLDGDGQPDIVVGAYADDDGGNNSGALWFLDLTPETQPPLISCPADVQVECQTSSGSIVTFAAPLASDDCTVAPQVVCTPPSGSLFAPGTTVVHCTATDLAGNASSCSFSVEVVDTTPPLISCPADLSVECTSATGAVISFSAPLVSDACDPAPAFQFVPPSGSLFPLGTTSVIASATDASGNTSQCSFDVTVVDTVAPLIACPGDVAAECLGPAGTPVAYPSPGVSDACDPAPVVSCEPPSGSLFPAGTTSVTCTATDAAGNAAVCSFDVVVADSTAPVIACPGDLIVECLSPDGAEVDFLVTATDSCDPSPVLTCTPPSGSLFPPGTTTVTCAAQDAAGNSDSCSFDVTVADTTAPTLSCPPLVTATTENAAGLMVAFSVTATDGCDPAPVVTCSPPSGSQFAAGITSVLCTATDASGNSSQCSFDVEVTVTLCQPDIGFGGSLTNVTSVEGDSAFDALSYDFDFIGDVDDDGRDDLVVAHVGNDDNGLFQSGSVRIYSGGTAALLFEVDGDAQDDRLGASVDAAFDVNGDGVPDIIAGATRTKPPLTGYALVVSGADGSVIHHLPSPSEGNRYGTAVSGLGDLDFDGKAEFAVAASGQEIGGPGVGRVTIHAGADAVPLLVLDGDATDDWFGRGLSAVGDVDGDGVPDLAVGAPQLGPLPSHAPSTGPGYVRIHSGLDGAVLHEFTGDLLGDRFGTVLDSAGDLDLDGVPDLLVGAPRITPGGTPGRGYAQVYSGASGAVLMRLDGTSPDELLGGSVAGGGDIDGDGVPDIVVGARLADLLGPDSGRAVAVSGADGSVLHSTAGAQPGELNGFAVATGGDLDGDGLSDVVVSSPFFDGSDTNTGRIQGFKPCAGHSGLVNPCNARISLCGDYLTTDGSLATFTLTDGEPFAPVFLILGLTFAPTPLLGSTLVPFPWSALVTGLSLDANGSLSFPVAGLAGAPVTVYVQVVLPIPGGFEFTNALAVQVGI